MTEDIKEKLTSVGIDVKDAQERFMDNEDMLLKFLHKFLSDTSYNTLLYEINEQNYEEAFKAAHTLKGVVLNLSIRSLYKPLIIIVECLRRGEKPKEESIQSMIQAYERLKIVLAEL